MFVPRINFIRVTIIQHYKLQYNFVYASKYKLT